MPPTASPRTTPLSTPLLPGGVGIVREGFAVPVRHAPERVGAGGRLLRAVPVAAVVLLVLAWPEGRAPALGALADAYVAVTVFVAATLLVLFALERGSGVTLSSLLERHARRQIPIAAALGALPGCGGAIAVIAQYTRGHVSFGGVVAALTATMGDAMFVLLAAEPATALFVLAVSAAVGVASGTVVDRLHGPGFLRPARAVEASRQREADEPLRALDYAWLVLLVPGLFLGAANAVQAEVAWAGPVGVAGALLALLMWTWRGGGGRVGSGGGVSSVVNDTNFVTAWVVAAFLAYELTVARLGLDLGAIFAASAPLVPLIAVLVGFVPGCGPQIVVTALYVSGAVPLSAQLGNAISNDGDALFPALALVPRAAFLATAYSAVPALVLAYAWWAMFERAAG